MMEVLIIATMVISLQDINVSSQNVVHLKFIQCCMPHTLSLKKSSLKKLKAVNIGGKAP